MKTIEKNTEPQLMQDLKKLWENKSTYRCVRLGFSNAKIEHEDWYDVMLNEIDSYFNEDIETVYRCYDDDVFFTTKTFNDRKVELFLNNLKFKLSSGCLRDIAHLFEVRVDWPKLRTMCEKKIENIRVLESKKNNQVKEKLNAVTREQAIKSLDKELIKSLSGRRSTREKSIVMVVEDDLFTQKLIKNTIKSTHELSITGDGQGAIINYVHCAPDVLFLDIGLPDIDGLSILEKILKIDPDAYIVMFSGNGDKSNVMKAIHAGAKGFVGKPFTKDKINQYIDKSPLIKNKQLHGAV